MDACYVQLYLLPTVLLDDAASPGGAACLESLKFLDERSSKLVLGRPKLVGSSNNSLCVLTSGVPRAEINHALETLSEFFQSSPRIWMFQLSAFAHPDQWRISEIQHAEQHTFYFPASVTTEERAKFEQAIYWLFFEIGEGTRCFEQPGQHQLPRNAVDHRVGGWSTELISYSGMEATAYMLWVGWADQAAADVFMSEPYPHRRLRHAIGLDVPKGLDFLEPLRQMAKVGYEIGDCSWEYLSAILPPHPERSGWCLVS